MAKMPNTPNTMAEALMLEMQRRIKAELKAWRMNPNKGPADWYNLSQQMAAMTTDAATFTTWAITEANIMAAGLDEED